MRLFSFKGRSGRMEYFLHNLIDDVVMIALIVIISVIMVAFEDSRASTIAAILGVLCIIAVLFLGIMSDIAVTVRRFHDLGRPGSGFWLLLIPIYNIILGLTLLFKRGIEGDNEYGPDPLIKRQKSTQPENRGIRQIDDQKRTFPEG